MQNFELKNDLNLEGKGVNQNIDLNLDNIKNNIDIELNKIKTEVSNIENKIEKKISFFTEFINILKNNSISDIKILGNFILE